MSRIGVLPNQTLGHLLAPCRIAGVDSKYVNPASIDLPLGEEAYRLENTILPRDGYTVRGMLTGAGATTHDLTKPLEVGVPYLIKVHGEWRLPEGVYGYVNPKSSTGRIFLSARVVADGVTMYDALTGPGWSGEIWVIVRPDRFPVLLYPELSLVQARLFDGPSFLDPLHLTLAIEDHGLLFDREKRRIKNPQRHADSLFLTVHVGEQMGWECRGSRRVLDLMQEQDPLDFFEPIQPRGDMFELRPGTSYILATRERVMVPPAFSAELRAIDPRFGEFRVHSAGYIDPGWGWGSDGSECGRPITLEVVPYEPMRIWAGQNIARIRYEHMKEPPLVPYDSANSHYVRQEGPALAKYFKDVA